MPKPRIQDGELQTRRNITLSDSLAEKAKQIGGGSISTGIRVALEEFKATDKKGQ